MSGAQDEPIRLRRWRAHSNIVEIEHTRDLRPIVSEESRVTGAVRAYVHALANPGLHDAAQALLTALRDVLPYATACIGLPRESWPRDSVILAAEAAIAKAEGLITPAEDAA